MRNKAWLAVAGCVAAMIVTVLPAPATAAPPTQPVPAPVSNQVAPAVPSAQPQADLAVVAASQECNTVLGELKAHPPAGRAVVNCIEPAGAASAAARSLVRSPGFAASIQELPQWCIDHAFDNRWWITRTQSCAIFQGTLTYVTNGTPVGQMLYLASNLSYMSTNVSNWTQQIELREITSTGIALGLPKTVEGSGLCEGCVVTNSNFPLQQMVKDKDAEGEVSFENRQTSPGAIVFANTEIDYVFFSPGVPPSTPGRVRPSRVRCDNALTVTGSTPGCVIPNFPPTMFYSLSGPYPELALHIGVAQQSGLPGARSGSPLHRLVNPSLQTNNRNAACPNPGYPRPVGKSCDEYPFASTSEGAFTARTNPTQPLPARTFSFCLIPEPPGTGPVGYSVCMINDGQNTDGGNALGRFFGNLVTTGERVLDGDAFFVSIVE